MKELNAVYVDIVIEDYQDIIRKNGVFALIAILNFLREYKSQVKQNFNTIYDIYENTEFIVSNLTTADREWILINFYECLEKYRKEEFNDFKKNNAKKRK